MAVYRRRAGERYWHWSPECASWPEGEEAILIPGDEYPEFLCPQCVEQGGGKENRRPKEGG
jgi:hypothetical protein